LQKLNQGSNDNGRTYLVVSKDYDMTRKYTDEEIQELAASYVLDLLSYKEKAEFESMLKGDGPASAHLDYFNEIMEDLTYNIEPLEEPKGLEERLFEYIRMNKL
jgi:anti-sigma-K factor RskA